VNIVVFGANGPTGRLLTRLAVDQGHDVVAVTRTPSSFPMQHPALRVVHGDVFDAGSVRAAVAGRNVVLSTLGVPYSKEPISTYSIGTRAMLDAMETHGLRRIVTVSSSAVDTAAGPHGGLFFEKVLQPYVTRVLGRTLYDDMTRMEQTLAESDVDWTVMRPSGLFDAEQVSDYEMAERYLPKKFTARIDLADAMLRQLDDERFIRTSAAVGTASGAPTVMQLMMREAFKRPPR